jgi:hypothetical protein
VSSKKPRLQGQVIVSPSPGAYLRRERASAIKASMAAMSQRVVWDLVDCDADLIILKAEQQATLQVWRILSLLFSVDFHVSAHLITLPNSQSPFQSIFVTSGSYIQQEIHSGLASQTMIESDAEVRMRSDLKVLQARVADMRTDIEVVCGVKNIVRCSLLSRSNVKPQWRASASQDPHHKLQCSHVCECCCSSFLIPP